MALEAYRFFSNNCREAMSAYQEIFGGELSVMSFADMPPGEESPPDVDRNLVMHSTLVFPDGAMLMASDDPTGDGGPVQGVSLHHGATTIEDGERIFAALADGGSTGVALEEVFWALRFGMCTDRFGTTWMISVDHPTDGS